MSEETPEMPAENQPASSPENNPEMTPEMMPEIAPERNGAEPEQTAESESAPENTPYAESATLAGTLAKYEIKLSAGKVRRLEAYARLLWEKNKDLNLTRHTDWDKFVTRDVIDSIHLASHLQIGENILDVGTGGGVPGVILTILRPDLRVDLCDSTGKKAVALGEILDALELKNNLWHAKAEELLTVRKYHTLVIRAVSKMDRLLTMFAPRWHAFDRILMLKGPAWVEERGLARHYGLLTNLALRKIDDYCNPGMEHESVILQVCRKNRLDEMNQRAQDLLDGKALEAVSEEVAVDNRPPESSKGRFGKGPGGKGTAGKGPSGKGPGGRGGAGKGCFSRSGFPRGSGRGSAEGSEKGDRRFDRTGSRRDGRPSGEKFGKGWVHPDTPFQKPKKSSQRTAMKRPGRPKKGNGRAGGSAPQGPKAD